jgi:ferritin-like metal-binding protein YciE
VRLRYPTHHSTRLAQFGSVAGPALGMRHCGPTSRLEGKTCDAIAGILEEGQEIMKEYKGMPALDAGLLAAAQAVEHYEIARYGTLRTWATELGLSKAAKLLEATLLEEKKTDEALTELAEGEVNRHAEAA